MICLRPYPTAMSMVSRLSTPASNLRTAIMFRSGWSEVLPNHTIHGYRYSRSVRDKTRAKFPGFGENFCDLITAREPQDDGGGDHIVIEAL